MNVSASSFLQIDFVSGSAAAAWAIAATWAPALAALVVPEVAGAFALAAYTRWIASVRG